MAEYDEAIELSEALSLLEGFVADNDDLYALEERIGRLNIFDALGIVRTEIRHSNFLAWLLDPGESHGQGSLFLRAVMMDILRKSRLDSRPFSPILLDGAELRGVQVHREFRGIDILIDCDEPRIILAIENKVDSREHSDQLSRYKTTVRDLFGESPAQFIFLTRDGDEPSDADWTIYTYRDIHDVLLRVRKANDASIGSDVQIFLDHYLNLIGSRFMNDPKIDELCQTIYKNHRRALDLIFEYAAPGPGTVLARLREILEKDQRVKILSSASSRIRFIPASWNEMLPSVGREGVGGSRNWLNLVLRATQTGCTLRFTVRPTSDPDVRLAVVERLTADPNEFGLKPFFKNIDNVGSHYTTLGRENVLSWRVDDEPDEDKLVSSFSKKLDMWLDRLAGVPDALGPVISKTMRSR